MHDQNTKGILIRGLCAATHMQKHPVGVTSWEDLLTRDKTRDQNFLSEKLSQCGLIAASFRSTGNLV